MRIGVLGGSFDPVHFGHMSLAEDAIREAGLDEVIMIPAKIQPFKQDVETVSGDDRLKMIELAAEGNDRIRASDYELKNERVSYTYLTMRAMQRHFDGIARSRGTDRARLYFISGMDSFFKIETWVMADELLNDYSYVVGTRPGYEGGELKECMERVTREHGTEIISIHNRQLDISSTEIRRRLAREQGIGDLVPAGVERYIMKNGLYR